MREIAQLLLEKAQVESRIRAHRVVVIRQYMANLLPEHKAQIQTRAIIRLTTEMEARVSAVHYCHMEFDELLDEIEDACGFNIQPNPKRKRAPRKSKDTP